MNRDPVPRRAPEIPRAFQSFFAAALCSISGCSNSIVGSTNPVVYGHVTHKGAPVTAGFVIFSPEVSEIGPVWGVGIVGSDGAYRITNNDRGLALDAGWYRVAVRPNLHPTEAQLHATEMKPVDRHGRSRGRDDREVQAAIDPTSTISAVDQPASEPESAPDPMIPRAYHNPDKSKLRIWIRPQPMRIDINLLD